MKMRKVRKRRAKHPSTMLQPCFNHASIMLCFNLLWNRIGFKLWCHIILVRTYKYVLIRNVREICVHVVCLKEKNNWPTYQLANWFNQYLIKSSNIGRTPVLKILHQDCLWGCFVHKGLCKDFPRETHVKDC